MRLQGHVLRVAIVGSRGYSDLASVREYVRKLPTVTTVVSGGAEGVDREAVETANWCGLAWHVFIADWTKHGKSAGAKRNAEIVAYCDRLVAFWDGRSKGTKITIDMAKRAGKQCEIITPKDQA
jgi:YspA, cpYpsA-related SLOG family